MKDVQMKKLFSIAIVSLIILSGCSNQPAYKNTKLTVDERVEDLVSRMTLEEKISQMSDNSLGLY
jgi:beta-glucosidase